MATSPFVTRIGGVIPWFFFDAIGRIVPGMYLIAVVILGSVSPDQVKALLALPQGSVTGFATSLVLLLIASYFMGFVLGPLSWLLEKLVWWSPWSIAKVREWYGLSEKTPAPIEECIETHLRFSIAEKKQDPKTEVPKTEDSKARDLKTEDQRIRSASKLCQFFVYDASYQLGLLSTRWDAEALAARNTMAASLAALILLPILTPHLYHSIFPGINLAFISVGIYFPSAFAYDYHRKKALMGKFDLFLACVSQRFSPTTPTTGE